MLTGVRRTIPNGWDSETRVLRGWELGGPAIGPGEMEGRLGTALVESLGDWAQVAQ